MQTENEAFAPTSREPKQQTQADAGIVARIVMVVALSLALVGVLHWAMSVTNANARHISTNLSRIRGAMDSSAPQTTPADNVAPKTRTEPRPTLEPVDR